MKTYFSLFLLLAGLLFIGACATLKDGDCKTTHTGMMQMGIDGCNWMIKGDDGNLYHLIKETE
ncbi:MAG: hypothetical protein AAFV80_04905, partial [Bacteroidota bacterium]